MFRIRAQLGAALCGLLVIATAQLGLASPAAAQDNLPVYTSPIDITGGFVTVATSTPDRETGAMIDRNVPAVFLPTDLAAVMKQPLNLVFDDEWNGVGINGPPPRQTACDGPNGVRTQVTQSAAQGGMYAYAVSCNFATSGSLFVKRSGNTLWLSYQLFNNTASFRASCGSVGTCGGCAVSDCAFTVRFMIEVLTVLRAPSICGLSAEPPIVHVHSAEIEGGNIPATITKFIASGDFIDAELAMEAKETISPLSLDDKLAKVRAAPICTGSGLQQLAGYTGLDVDVGPGIALKAIHPPIEAPTFDPVLGFGEDTCKSGFVWREAFAGDHVCVAPATQSQAFADNSLANTRRRPDPTGFGAVVCLPGFVWREARATDHVCVEPQVRAQAALDNAAASSRRVVGPPPPGFLRPMVQAPPIVTAGQPFTMVGHDFPFVFVSDPSTLSLSVERSANSACNGGYSELETTIGSGPPSTQHLSPTGAQSKCAYKYRATGLMIGTSYAFRIRDCDSATCSPWSARASVVPQPAAVTLPPAPVQITVDGLAIGSAPLDRGTFQVSVTLPAATAAGTHSLRATSGQAYDKADIQVVGAFGGAKPQIVLTAAFYGDMGCPMRPAGNDILADGDFALFGTGFANKGPVILFLDAPSAMGLAGAILEPNGTFCITHIRGPAASLAGPHTLLAVQRGLIVASLPVQVVVYRGPA